MPVPQVQMTPHGPEGVGRADSPAQPRCVSESFARRGGRVTVVLVLRPNTRSLHTEQVHTMKLRIDIAGVGFFCTRPPEPKVDFETGAVRTDRESGDTLWRVQVAALDASGGEILVVTVPGEPDVTIGSPVQIKGLVAIPWSQGERSGVAYRAESLRSTGTPIAGVITPPAVAAAPGEASKPSGQAGSGTKAA